MENKEVVAGVGLTVAVGAVCYGAWKLKEYLEDEIGIEVEEPEEETITIFNEFVDVLSESERESFLRKGILLIQESEKVLFPEKFTKIKALMETYLQTAVGYHYDNVDWEEFEDSLVPLNKFITKNLRHFHGNKEKIMDLYDSVVEVVACSARKKEFDYA